MPRLTLTVDARKHPKAARDDDPSQGVREIGFTVTATLTSDAKVVAGLQTKYKLVQYVRDRYWVDLLVDGSWESQSPEGTLDTWIRDEFGRDDDRGVWESNATTTVFSDQPGFLGKGKNGQALPSTQRLGDYQIELKWTIQAPQSVHNDLLQLKLVASPDDGGTIDYYAEVAGQRKSLPYSASTFVDVA